jgi:catechol 2,3-dioxygenase
MSAAAPRYEIAHLAHAELYTADLDGSLWFF